eukprot:gene6066-8351_t
MVGEEDEVEELQNDDQFEQQMFKAINNQTRDTWAQGGPRKNEVLRELIKCFGSLVQSSPKGNTLPDHRGRFAADDLEYTKLINAGKYVNKARKALYLNENFDTREFSIFIAKKNWVRNNLRPLIELCAKDDSNLVLKCCGLAMVLIKRMSDKALKYLQVETKKKIKKQDNKQDKGDEEEVDLTDREGEIKIDAQEQLSVLLLFKESLLSEKCNEAITNAFREYWMKELVQTDENNKREIARCFSYLRRLLAIDTNPAWSTPGEIMKHRQIHYKYLIQLRQILAVIPGICSDIMRSYHDDWLIDIILIISFSFRFDNNTFISSHRQSKVYPTLQSYFRGFEAKDLFEVWKSGSLIDKFEDFESIDDPSDPHSLSNKYSSKEINVPSNLLSSSSQTKGLLTKLMNREKIDRKLVAEKFHNNSTRHGRFGGMYQIQMRNGTSNTSPNNSSTNNPQSNQKNDKKDVEPKTDNRVPMRPVMIRRNPFLTADALLPQVKATKNKKNQTFSQKKGSDIASQHLSFETNTSDERKQACVVVASLVNLLSNEISFKSLVKRVNEDLRRDEGRVDMFVELKYFEILYVTLHYNRLKLEDDYQKCETNENGATNWSPQLKNIMDTLDKLSFNRVVRSIIKEINNKNRDNVCIPMQLYCEMISHIRILLQSSIEGHRDIAIATLYRVFYTTNDRLDPLLKILSDWQPSIYSKQHINAIVELVHVTLRTLDLAAQIYKNDSILNNENNKSQKKKKDKKEMDLETYIISCARFNVDEYFKKIANNNTIRLYTKLLSNYEKNDISINQYIYGFFARMIAFKLEQDYRHNNNDNNNNNNNSDDINNEDIMKNDNHDEVSLGYMLFNIQTFQVFSCILNDPHVHYPEYRYLEPLIRLIKSLFRQFQYAASKNQMLFVELLFLHPYAHDFCLELDNIYHANDYAITTNDDIFIQKSNKKYKKQSEELLLSNKKKGVDDYGDEFDENVEFSFENQHEVISSRLKNKKRKGNNNDNNKNQTKVKKLKKNKIISQKTNNSDDDESMVDASSEDDYLNNVKGRKPKQQNLKKAMIDDNNSIDNNSKDENAMVLSDEDNNNDNNDNNDGNINKNKNVKNNNDDEQSTFKEIFDAKPYWEDENSPQAEKSSLLDKIIDEYSYDIDNISMNKMGNNLKDLDSLLDYNNDDENSKTNNKSLNKLKKLNTK